MQKADPVFLQLPIVEWCHHCSHGHGLEAQRRMQEVDRGTQRVRARLAVSAAAGGEIGIGRHEFKCAAGEQLLQRRSRLRSPLLQRLFARPIVFLPAKQRCIRTHRDGAQYVAYVGEKGIGWRQIGGGNLEIASRNAHRREGVGESIGGTESFGQLIRAV